jgi:glyoxylase-like metal-dependent hydrolase (beta-lactamase superfamily II)
VEILPNLHRVPGVVANVYLLVDPGGLSLIDAGLPRQDAKILEYIASLGFAPQDLKHILITHADSDHVGGLAGLQAVTPARTYASPIEAEAIQAGRFSRPLKLEGWRKWLFQISTRIFRITPGSVDEMLVEEQELPIWGGLRVLKTPGHTPGHLSYYAFDTGVLFPGDSLRCQHDAITVSRGANTWDEGLAHRSALEQATLSARVVCAGHGPVVQDAASKFASLRDQLENKGMRPT